MRAIWKKWEQYDKCLNSEYCFSRVVLDVLIQHNLLFVQIIIVLIFYRCRSTIMKKRSTKLESCMEAKALEMMSTKIFGWYVFNSLQTFRRFFLYCFFSTRKIGILRFAICKNKSKECTRIQFECNIFVTQFVACSYHPSAFSLFSSSLLSVSLLLSLMLIFYIWHLRILNSDFWIDL
jgi:hypothetical protein